MYKRTKQLIVSSSLVIGLAAAQVAMAEEASSSNTEALAKIAIAVGQNGGDAVNFVSQTTRLGMGHGAYHAITWSGPYVEIDPVSKEERYFFRVRSDARGRDPNTNGATIPMAQFFDTWDTATASMAYEGDGIKHSDRIRGLPVERRMTVDAGNVAVIHTVNFHSRWGHWNTAFPTTRVYIVGTMKPAYREVAALQ